LLDASGSRIYAEIVKPLIARTIFFLPLDFPMMRAALEGHLRILAALKRGNREQAAFMLKEDMDRATRIFSSRMHTDGRTAMDLPPRTDLSKAAGGDRKVSGGMRQPQRGSHAPTKAKRPRKTSSRKRHQA
jgi:hypothetical protein